MIVIAAVDDNNGMMFNRRRQSQDRNLRNYILEMVKGSRLFMNEYTYRQFAEMGEVGSICVAENFLECATDDDYCFVENMALSAYETSVSKFILFKWNRRYPADFYFDISLSEPKWKLTETEDFRGSSHEKITREVYERCIEK